MRSIRLAAVIVQLLAITASASAQPPPPRGAGPSRAAADVDVSLFYEQLAPMGAWVHVAPHGWVWTPYDVDPEWKPYQAGHWVWTECGWTWASDEPFGWAVYHYGRWYHDPFHGWVWVPGTQWGPAWVAWRRGDGWLGWAPLPPEREHHGDRLTFDVSTIRRHSWCFVEERSFCETNLRPHLARPSRNVNIVNVTQNVTNYTVVNHTVINNSVKIDTIEKRIGRTVPRFRIREESRPGISIRVDVKNSVLGLFRPRISDGPAKRTPDVIFPVRKGGGPGKLGRDFDRRHHDEMEALSRRNAAERAAFEDRQKRERGRIGKMGIKIDELNKRHAREREALNEQAERNKKLLERQHEREVKGDTGRTQSKENRFRYGSTGKRN